jgi:hypothetical protein
MKPSIQNEVIYQGYKLTKLGELLQELHRQIFDTLIEEKKIGTYIEHKEVPKMFKPFLYDVELCFPKETVLTFDYDET